VISLAGAYAGSRKREVEMISLAHARLPAHANRFSRSVSTFELLAASTCIFKHAQGVSTFELDDHE
jgi:hypothetical protein